MRTPASVGWSPLPTLVVCWALLAQVLSFRGVVIWAGGCSLLVLLAMRALLTARRPVPAMLAGVVLTLAFAYLADAYGGSTSGPLARATLLACGLTAAATAIAFTRHPLLLLAPSLALLGSVLALGAAGSAGAWVGLWAVAAAVTAAMLGPYRKHDLAAAARLVPFALLIAGAGLVAVAALVIFSPMLGTPWTIPGARETSSADAAAVVQPVPPAAQPSIAPEPVVAPEVSEAVAPSQAAEVVAPPVLVEAPPESAIDSVVSTIIQWVLVALLAVLLLFVLLLIWLLVRRIVSWIRWRSLRWRLSRGTPEQRVVGAWTYLRLRLDARGDPLPASASPDVAAGWASQAGDPALATVARLTARVAFNPEGTMSMPDSALAWEQALRFDRAHRRQRH